MPRTRPTERTAPSLAKEALERAALAYLERYATSAENLRRVLVRRIRRAERLGGADVEGARERVDEIVSRFLGARLVDDQAYAEMRTASLHRRGFSRRGIEQALQAKGLESAEIRGALERLASERAAPELEAAVAYVRRRRLGPLRPDTRRAECRDKDLAALARRGFSFEVARRVIDAEDALALEVLARGERAG